jgi:hypothetical protein
VNLLHPPDFIPTQLSLDERLNAWENIPCSIRKTQTNPDPPQEQVIQMLNGFEARGPTDFCPQSGQTGDWS